MVLLTAGRRGAWYSVREPERQRGVRTGVDAIERRRLVRDDIARRVGDLYARLDTPA